MMLRSVWKTIGILWGSALALSACTSISSVNMNRYQLTEVSKVAHTKAQRHLSILVMQPAAIDGYTTEQMLYVNKPYQIGAFANNSWMSPPATMLLPLLIRGLESSHYFYAVATDPNVSKTDYRLESVLLCLQQNFMMKPSHLQLVMQVMLVHSTDSRVVATDIIYESIPCSSDTPLGGVLAGNQATRHLTSRITHFVIEHVKRDLKE